MGVERLSAVLQSHRHVALDSSVFIYQLDRRARYFPLSDCLFGWLAKRGHSAVSSTLSFTEILVPAYQEGEEKRIQAYYAFLSTYPNLTWVPTVLEIADQAARLRCTYGLKTPDAIHAATAIHAKATLFVTNDFVFKRVKEMDSLILDELL